MAKAKKPAAPLVTDEEKWAAVAEFVKALGALPHFADVARQKLLDVLGK